MNPELAKTVIDQMGAQTELIMTLALGVAGGIIALLIRLMLHNSEASNTSLNLKGNWLLLAALVLEGVSVACAVLARATITATTPIVYSVDFTAVRNWSDASYEGATAIRVAAGSQFVFFLLGLGLVCVFILCNVRVISESKRALSSQEGHNV